MALSSKVRAEPGVCVGLGPAVGGRYVKGDGARSQGDLRKEKANSREEMTRFRK